MIKFNWAQLSDSEFEDLCKDILREVGLENVKRMSGPGSGDMGRDLIAEETIFPKIGNKLTIKTLVQCKNYGKSKVTISPSEIERYALRAETLGYDFLLIITSHDLSSQAKIISEKISQDSRRRVKVTFWTEADLVDKLIQLSKIRDKYFSIPLLVKDNTLKIKGFVDREGHIYTSAFVFYQDGKEPIPIMFLVDTGATTTTILSNDAVKLGLDFNSLKKGGSVRGIGGVIREMYILSDVTILFMTQDEIIHSEKLDKVNVIKLSKDELPLHFSILGIDVLKGFNILFDEGILFR